jgi:WD40 repeat protein
MKFKDDRIVVGGRDGSVAMYSMRDLTTISKFIQPSPKKLPVASLQFDHNKLITGGRDGAIRVFSLKPAKQLYW